MKYESYVVMEKDVELKMYQKRDMSFQRNSLGQPCSFFKLLVFSRLVSKTSCAHVHIYWDRFWTGIKNNVTVFNFQLA